MTAAERQQRKRDRVKSGLVRLEFWVPADKADEVKTAIAHVLALPNCPTLGRECPTDA